MLKRIKLTLHRILSPLLTIAIIVSASGVSITEISAAETATAAAASATKKKKSSKKRKSTKSTSKKRNTRKRNTRRRARRRSRAHATVRRTPLVIRGTQGVIPQADPFVSVYRDDSIPAGLDGRNIAIWASHGLYYNPTYGGWEWQRPYLFGTREDLLSTSFVYPYIIPMLENAGAYVMTPRERDSSPHEAVADADRSRNGSFTATDGVEGWQPLDSVGYIHPLGAISGSYNPFVSGTAMTAVTVGDDASDEDISSAAWSVEMPERGNYAVYITYPQVENAAPDATFTVNHLGGSTDVTVNQTMGGGTWIYLGTFDIPSGKQERPLVELTNISSAPGTIVVADAVKVGGGMGNVAWTGTGGAPYISGARRFDEGASTYLRSAGMPEGVWNPSQGESLYKNDYMSRAHWANYLAGGSPILPDTTGLRIPVDLAFALHTDAGISDNVVGTLALYSTDDGNPFGNGSSRHANADFSNAMLQAVTSDIRALYDPGWNQRGSLDRRYYEVRETKMPAMILEALSHQNYVDMQRAYDPEFKFIISRAIYKTILRFLADRYGTEAVIQPLPIKDFAITHKGPHKYRLSWQPTHDTLEPTAAPTYFVIEERVDDGGFNRIGTSSSPHYDVEINDDNIHSYRITAANEGGYSFPSEVLSLYDYRGENPEITIVNGFTRVSAPQTDSIACRFDPTADPGVPDGKSYGLDGDRIGNTHDYTFHHGRAIRSSGRGYVSTSASAFESDKHAVATPAVDFIGGLQKATLHPGSGELRHTVMSPRMRARLTEHLKRGGGLMVSGSYIPSELMQNHLSDSIERISTQQFGTEILGIDLGIMRAAKSGNVNVKIGGNWTFRPNNYRFPVVENKNTYAVIAPESPYPAEGATAILQYEENGLPAAIVYRRLWPETGAEGRVVTLGFPFETLSDNSDADTLMTDILTYLLDFPSKTQKR